MSPCVETYCINVPTEGSTTILVGLDALGFSAATGLDGMGDPIFAGGAAGASPVFDVPFGAAVRVYNTDSQSHTVAAEDGSWTVAIAADTDESLPADTGEFARIKIHCPDHVTAGVSDKRATLRIKQAGPADVNQSEDGNEHSGGCCRVSIKATQRHWYYGFSRFDGQVFPKYRTITATDQLSPWTESAFKTHWKGVEVTGSGTIAGTDHITRERFRSLRYIVRGRPEIIRDGYTYDAFFPLAYGGISGGGRVEYYEDYPGGFENEDFDIWTWRCEVVGDWNVVSSTRREKEIRWFYTKFSEEDAIDYDGGLAGIRFEELSDEYTAAEFAADCNAQLSSWTDITWPDTAIETQWFTSPLAPFEPANDTEGDEPSLRYANGCQLTQPWFGLDIAYADTDTAPLFSQRPEDIAGTSVDYGTLPDYRCVFSDYGNSLTGQYPANIDSQPDPDPISSLSGPLWAPGPPSSPLRNACASAQIGDDIISPPLHYMSALTLTVPADGAFILVERTAVKRWYSGSYCRRVWEDKGTALLVKCEHNAGTFDGANKVPEGATYDALGKYTLTGLTNLEAYRWTKGANDTSLEHAGETYTEDFAFTMTTDPGGVVLSGVADSPVTATVRPNNSAAPCAVIDDVAENVDMYDASLGLGSTWAKAAEWMAEIGAGQVWTTFSEIDCPNNSAATDPPCGCPPEP